MKLMKYVSIFLFILIEFVWGNSLYETLGIKKNASKKEIKAAYKKLAMEWFARVISHQFYSCVLPVTGGSLVSLYVGHMT